MPAEPESAMDRRELLLAVLASAKGRPFQPAQIQKLGCLVSHRSKVAGLALSWPPAWAEELS
jgi:hypothetical protein